MTTLTRVISSSFDKAKRRLIKVLRFGKSDVQTAYEGAPYGVDGNPIKDMVAIYAETSQKGKTVIIGYLNKNQLAQPGELRLYSTDDAGGLKFYTWLKKDGTYEIGGAGDHMVRYSALETAFNQFKQDFNLHVHPSNGSPPTTPTAADITGAKINEVKTL